MIGIIIAVVVGLLVLFFIGTYNMLVQSRNRVQNGWHQIDVQLKRRIDLIPNLVETVKGYAAHERAIFEKIAEARQQAIGAKGPAEAAKANNQLSETLKTLFAVVENYPDLKANQNFLKLQEELAHTENKISFARQFYNDVVMDYNNRVQMFPSSIIAGMFGFKPAEFYTVPDTEREAPKVQF
ncbi:LemA family protein [candidate division WOR-3 bacterium]|nr:LemA family protein [candidate division WOR-3 bacterium]